MATSTVAIITVDGPSGAGKGTVCHRLAKITGYSLLDSGALYRLTALATRLDEVNFNDEQAVAGVAKHLAIAFQPGEDSVRTMLRNRDVTADIRTEEVSMNASRVAAMPAVRNALLQRQRDFARPPGLVADGRDMGTVVFPEAPVKIFLTADADERARRRYLQLQQAGEVADLAVILADIKARDERDSARTAAPLRPADDALILDSTHLSIEQVLEQIMAQVQRTIGVRER